MRRTIPSCFLAAGILLISAIGTTSAARIDSTEDVCSVFASSPGASRREYRSCEECLDHHERCEERCAAETGGYVCTAVGYDRRDRKQTVQGDVSERERRAARRSAIERCSEQGLLDCEIDSCAENQQAGIDDVRPCSANTDVVPERRDRARRSERAALPPQPEPPASTKKYIVSWQHIKDQCMSKPYPKIAQQCRNRANFWQGIHCRVTWSDGSVEEIGGKVDLTDAYGRAYCTRPTRPAKFNCVSRCDDTPGPLMTLPRP
ncbi:MAG: hypothetical protein CDV28_11130 [Candidatus Electronema aureum]|uniref:DUF4189 domain-containing protein n=1 Tax=Candidatus Electronema aureum TaxID=2005002 RepID=A0A521G261_9BACT|nr:MAG: hypothetical protein CDV28_11130 [Candidatus Electronema aureum]